MIKKYLNQTCIVKTPSTFNDYGEPTYTEVTTKCRFESGSGYAKDLDGRDVISDGTLFTASKLPGEGRVEHDDINYIIVTSRSVPKLNGTISHYETKLGKSGGR